MASYTATVDWALQPGEDFLAGRYSRKHTVSFDAGITVPASASPHVVPAPWSAADAIDPEEMLVAAISNCHMLSFLYIASRAGFIVLSYRDEAEGLMRKNPEGKIAVTRVSPCARPSSSTAASRRPRRSTSCITRPMKSATSPAR